MLPDQYRTCVEYCSTIIPVVHKRLPQFKQQKQYCTLRRCTVCNQLIVSTYGVAVCDTRRRRERAKESHKLSKILQDRPRSVGSTHPSFFFALSCVVGRWEGGAAGGAPPMRSF